MSNGNGNNTVPRKGFRVAPQPTKGQVMEENLTLAQELSGKFQQLETQTRFMSNVLAQTMKAIQQLGPEVNALSTIEAAVLSSEPAKENDYVMIDYLGRLLNEDGSDELDKDGDPVYFDGGFGSKYTILGLGGGTLVPGFEAQLVGVRPGDSVEITVTFPKDYAKELAERKAKFQIYVHRVYTPLSQSPVEKIKMNHDLKKAKLAQARAEAKAAEEAAKKAAAGEPVVPNEAASTQEQPSQ